MIPQTTLLIHFYANTVEGGQKMILLTDLLTRFYANTAAGGASDVSPGTLFNEYRGRWCIRCIT